MQADGLNGNKLRNGQPAENQWVSQNDGVRPERGKPRSHNWPYVNRWRCWSRVMK